MESTFSEQYLDGVPRLFRLLVGEEVPRKQTLDRPPGILQLMHEVAVGVVKDGGIDGPSDEERLQAFEVPVIGSPCQSWAKQEGKNQKPGYRYAQPRAYTRSRMTLQPWH